MSEAFEYPQVDLVAPGIWSIRVPLPFGPRGGTLVYLVDSDAGPVLVDSGWDTDECWDALVEGITLTGHAVEEVHGALVTHFHADHHGLSDRVRQASGAWVALHPEDARMITRQRAEGSRLGGITSAFYLAGAPMESYLDVPDRALAHEIPKPTLPDRLLGDGDLADVPGRSVRAIWTPGHTPGHLCFWIEDARLMLTGDHVLPKITPHIGVWLEDERDPLGDYLSSLGRLLPYEVDEVLPAHEHRFAGLASRLEALIEHHRVQLEAVIEQLRQGPATVWDVAEAMPWGVAWEKIPAAMRHVALAEARAHIQHLEHRGDVRAVDGAPTRYALA